MTRPVEAASSISIPRLRAFILILLIAGVAVFTGVMLTLVRSLSERFGPQVEEDLEWRALRGAQELSMVTDLGLAVGDPAMVGESFGPYSKASDVAAIVAVDASGTMIASHGKFASSDAVFAAAPRTLVRGKGWIASWAPSVIEGKQVGKVAVIVSTTRLADAQTLLSGVSRTTLVAGIATALFGALGVLLFTRAVSVRDHRLNDYALNLERMVEARTHELDDRNHGMRLVLDNVAQGFVTVDLDGVMASERSAVVDRWFGEPAPGMTFSAFLERQDPPLDPPLGAWLDLGLETLRCQWLPLDLCLAQIQSRFTMGHQTFELKASPIKVGDKVERLLFVISDVTAQIAREHGEREQREIVTLFQRITADRAGFDDFMDEAAEQVMALARPGDPVAEQRTLHTLKGNCAIFGFDSFAELCHDIETELGEGGALREHHRSALKDGWRKLTGRMVSLLGDTRPNLVEIELTELSRLVDRIRQVQVQGNGQGQGQAQAMTSGEIAAALVSLSHEPVSRRFARLGRYAVNLGRRLNKGDIEIENRDNGLRLDSTRWTGFWSAMVHAVRNAVDHGIADPATRASAGKPASAKLTFTAWREPGVLLISVTDDGSGIRWEAVRERARRLNLPAETQRDLENALFADGVSTAAEVTEISGRGVGLAALRSEVAALGGTIEIDSNPGLGTTIRCRFPEVTSQVLLMRRPTQRNRQLTRPP